MPMSYGTMLELEVAPDLKSSLCLQHHSSYVVLCVEGISPDCWLFFDEFFFESITALIVGSCESFLFYY